MVELFKKTVAYRILSGDKRNGCLSHAYMLVCQDGAVLAEYLRIVAKIITCADDASGFCNECRTCRLIDKGVYSDVQIYPKGGGGKILVADVDEVVSQSYVKPFEGDKRVFALSASESIMPQAQNKILKTLEEPPKGVFVLLGTTNESSILSTVKSRMKKLVVPDFSEEDITEALSRRFPEKDGAELAKIAALADGKMGTAISLAEKGTDGEAVTALVLNMLENMRSSRNVIEFSSKIDKNNVREYLITLKKVLNRAVRFSCGADEKSGAIRRISQDYGTAACLAIINRINSCERTLAFNGNVNMIADGILLGVLEEKFKWKKL